jgi:phospholipase D1/2
MPAVPAFAGDLHAESSLGTLAIMQFQYRSISRGGDSIMEMIDKAGFNSKDYINFYNLRSYDRINVSASMKTAEQASGVSYEAARKEHDDQVGAGFDGRGEGTDADASDPNSKYARYQQAADSNHDSNFDSISSAYMANGPNLSSIPWADGNVDEIDAFVSEELYIHSKILVADDRIVICGSANLNDRSQLGDHDSEIAVVIEDTATAPSSMNGTSYTAARFAASLRRQIFRKHLGLLPFQDPTKPDDNFLPVDKKANSYDWGSDFDKLVEDPLSPEFEALWTSTARTNTEVFEKVFRPVPTNAVRNWEQYHDYYGKYFIPPAPKEGEKAEDMKSPYRYGHVFKESFPGGVQEVKAELEKVRGTLVDMPLDFLVEVGNLAKEGFSYNSLTEDLYT